MLSRIESRHAVLQNGAGFFSLALKSYVPDYFPSEAIGSIIIVRPHTLFIVYRVFCIDIPRETTMAARNDDNGRWFLYEGDGEVQDKSVPDSITSIGVRQLTL